MQGGNDIFYFFNTAENGARANYYGVSGIPTARCDGNRTISSSGAYTSTINSELTYESPVTMSLSGDYNAASDTGHIIVTTFTEADSGYTNLRLRVALDESHIHLVHPPSVPIHNQTFRDMMPSSSGKTITLTVGETRYDTFTFVTRTPINSDSSEIVAFIQSERTSPAPLKRVLQATKIRVNDLMLNGIDDLTEMPNRFALQQNYPNPFNAQTQIGFDTKGGAVKLEVYNITGAKVTTLINGDLSSGHHSIVWDGRDNTGTQVSSGVYFYRFSDPNGTQVRRMILMK